MGDVMYSVVAIFNNTILHIWKLLKESILKDLITRKKTFCNYVWWLTMVIEGKLQGSK